MRRLLLAGILVTVLLVAFAGSALADGPYGYTGYNNGYGGGYGGYSNGCCYGGYQMQYSNYNYNYGCCSYVNTYNYWCHQPKVYSRPKGYASYNNYNMYNSYGGYGGG